MPPRVERLKPNPQLQAKFDALPADAQSYLRDGARLKRPGITVEEQTALRQERRDLIANMPPEDQRLLVGYIILRDGLI